MNERINEHGQPIGVALDGWCGVPHPGHCRLEGRYVTLEPLKAAHHAQELFDAFGADPSGATWTYISDGPFDTVKDLGRWLESIEGVDEQPFFVVVDRSDNRPKGIASYLRIQPQNGVIEIGGITFAPGLQRTRVATEAIYLMMRRALSELGYRRLEWKCDTLNAPSRRAADRFGFRFDGIFEQAIVYKGRNRDTAWFSLLDRDWAPVDRGFQAWLAKENFDETGQQRRKLADLIATESDTVKTG